MMGGGSGGRGNPMRISTAAIVGIGTTIMNAKSIVPKSSLFILLPPLCITDVTPVRGAFLNLKRENIFH
jgi:hypothetical protein